MGEIGQILMLYVAPLLIGIGVAQGVNKMELPEGQSVSKGKLVFLGIVAAVIVHLGFRFIT